MKSSANYFSGTSGILLPYRNKKYYPKEFADKSRLKVYSSLCNSVEINSSFYKIPRRQTIEKWASDVPEDFRFTFKLFKGITHTKGLNFGPADVSKFFDAINGVQDKKGCLLVQFPPSVSAVYFKEVIALINCMRENDGQGDWKIALEFRHNSWYIDEVYELLADYKMGLVLHDKSPSATPMLDSDIDFRYVRFHGPIGNYRDSYSEEFLEEYASYSKDWLADGKKVYVYFNNTMGDALANLQTLSQLIK